MCDNTRFKTNDGWLYFTDDGKILTSLEDIKMWSSISTPNNIHVDPVYAWMNSTRAKHA
jgi:hypothetical protein